MNQKLFTLVLSMCLTMTFLSKVIGQTVKAPIPFTYTVQAAPEWTSLFNRTDGWFGADGIFSIPLNGNDYARHKKKDSILLLFSDTYIGKVENKKPLPGNTMVNNTIAYVKDIDPDPNSIQFYYKTSAEGKPETFFIPTTTTEKKPQLFWLGDGFVNKELNNNLNIIGYKVERTGPGVFDFIETAVSIISIPGGERAPFEHQKQIETSLHINNARLGEGNFGSGIFVNTKWAGAQHPDGFVYIYGCLGKDKNLVVSRVKPADFENLNAWRYWNGIDWSENSTELKALTNSASDELSLTQLPDGRFILIFQVLGLSDKVGMRIADSPVGPFSDITEIWSAPEWKEGLWTYNAKAHPSLSKPGELLISYNTITPDFWNDIEKDATIYHPRFIKLKYNLKGNNK